MTDITANVVVSMPSQLFTMARSFKAVANGKIYIGKIDTDPVNPENQIPVYVENEDGSHVPVSQPIIINAAGYPVYNGQIAKFVTVQGHSMAVYDAYGSQQFYFPNVLKYDPDQLSVMLNLSWLRGMNGFLGGEVYPNKIGIDAKIGDLIPEGVRFVRLDGTLMMMSTPLSSPLTITSYDSTVINDNIELYPISFFNEVNSGWKIAQNDAQLSRLLPLSGNIGIAYSPVTVEGIFNIQGDILIKPLLPKVTVDSRQLWLRSPRTWNESNQEFDYTPYDIRIVGNFLFDFYRQNASFDPGVGLAMQSAGTLELSGCELQGAWNSNVTMDYGRWVLADNLYSHDCGRGKIQDPDGSNRTGMAIIVNDPTEAHVHHIRCRNTWASSLFFSSRRPNRTLNLMIHDVSINTSGGNGLRIQSDDLVNGYGDGTAITRVNINAVTIKNCESHGLRGNFRNGVVTGLYVESSNAGVAIEGASDVSYDNVIIRNCSQGLLCRFYPVENTRMRFSNFLISGCSAEAVYFLRNPANTTTNLADIEFDGITIHALANGAKGFVFNGGPAAVPTTDLTLKNVRIVGAYPNTENGHYIVIINCRHIEVDNVNLRGCNGSAESYLQALATQSVIVNRLVAVQPFGTVNRPIYTNGSGSDAIVNITNCVAPDTTTGSIGYNPVPTKRYEANNQFANSSQPQQYPFTNSGALRGGDVNTLSTKDVANIVATLVNDISNGKFVVR
ncbi:phage head-binding domain-containing protein [Escherichia coli]|uniref:phage head-binding domain-containing protein n=1 Tax=Escherichia coli TaxID=562 RepID=UPI001F3FB9FB|nr:phage head-binding domain-containing protein [Escherichia coli]MEC5284662.1 phage head-binding domain-containing protein [Escherichia coli]MEC5288302.1 phage head-binding domain-containing protein [Escherichia coli]MEC5288313.1 phage head-binding domain-containing protein [Escherichia coli]